MLGIPPPRPASDRTAVDLDTHVGTGWPREWPCGSRNCEGTTAHLSSTIECATYECQDCGRIFTIHRGDDNLY